MMSVVRVAAAALAVAFIFIMIYVSVKKPTKDKYGPASRSLERPAMAAQTYLNTLHGPIELLQKQCLKLFEKGSFWLSARSDHGNSLVENVVRQIFAYHVPDDFRFSAEAGAEFWVQIRDQTIHDSLPFHFDKDELMFSTQGLMRNPHIATVTYLSGDVSPPTVVFTLTPDDVDIKTDRCFKPPDRAFVSFPLLGKHLAFQGNMYHGVLGRMRNQLSTVPRVTLLVNIWLTGRPANTKIFRDDDEASHSVILFRPSQQEMPKFVDNTGCNEGAEAPIRDIPLHVLEDPNVSSCIVNY